MLEFIYHEEIIYIETERIANSSRSTGFTQTGGYRTNLCFIIPVSFIGPNTIYRLIIIISHLFILINISTYTYMRLFLIFIHFS